MARSYFASVLRMTPTRALRLAAELRQRDPHSTAHLSLVEQALIRLAAVRKPHATTQRRLKQLQRDTAALRKALDAQCQRVYGQQRDLDRVITLLAVGLKAVRQASNSVPCSLPHCTLCRWVREARYVAGTANWRRVRRVFRSHALEAHLERDYPELDGADPADPAHPAHGGAGPAGTGDGHGSDPPTALSHP